MNHPSNSELKQFATGQLNDARFEEIAAHVEACEQCSEVLEQTGAFPDLRLLRNTANTVLAEISKGLPEVPHVVLRDDASPNRIVRPNSPEMPKGNHGRYHVQGEIARGGMGAILKGRDNDLGRDLAIKVLLANHKEKPEVLNRFVEEAQIGGQLQHPGIVPVYELGQFADQRPFFTMKLVKGQTLTAILADRNDMTTDRPKLLGIFEQVCQTIAYAHSKGVIHRDLKPSNVMVGAFGEVQVMDWGLAKVLAKGGVADELKSKLEQATVHSVIRTLRSEGSDASDGVGSETHYGSVMGTPAYMSPEQALGEVDRLDERADVFALGSMLCEILTGKPAYSADTPKEVYRKAARGNLDDAFRRLSNEVESDEITAICKRCLGIEPKDRPRNAVVIAADVAGYIESVDNRLREAELDRVEAQTKAEEERKRRKVWLALAGTAFVTLLLAGGGWVWLQQKEAALARAESERQLVELEERSRWERQVSSELSTAQALVATSAGVPDPASLQRGLDAINRGLAILDEHNVDESVAEEVRAANTRMLELQANAGLVSELERIWELEMAQQAEARLAANGVEVDWRSLAEQPDKDPIARYQSAFSVWFEPARDSNIEFGPDFAKRVQSLPELQRQAAIVSLDRWRHLLAQPRSITRWQQSDWKTLDSVELKSRGGDRLEVQPDGSILASGKNVHAGYELTFETDVTQLTALRLEALLDESLPKNGPGRGEDGEFFIEGLKIQGAPRDKSNDVTQLRFRSAVADFSHVYFPITAERWNVVETGQFKDRERAKPRVAVFELEQPLQSNAGFRLLISHDDRPRMHMEDLNLGRFRWSISSEHDTLRVDQLTNLVHALDDDPWRREMRAEREARDIAALIRRAEDESILESQPRIVLIQLAEWLRSFTGLELAKTLPPDIHWEVLRPDELSSAGNATLTLRDDGSILVSGVNPDWDTVTLRVAKGESPITAIRLEMIPTKTLPDSPLHWTSRQGQGVHIRELQAAVITADDQNPIELTPVLAFASYPWSLPLTAMFDGTPLDTGFPQPNDPADVVIVFDPHQASKSGQLEIRIQGGGVANMSCFRLSASRTILQALNPPRAATTLLTRMHERNPSDAWIRLSLAESLLGQLPIDRQEALRHATAAVALKPEMALAHASVCRSLPIEKATIDNDTGQAFLHHFRRIQKLNPANPWRSLAGRFGTLGWQYFHLRNMPDEAISRYRVWQDLLPNDSVSYNLIGLAYLRNDEYEHAIESFRRAIELRPGHSTYCNNLIHALEQSGQIDASVEVYQDAIAHDPTNSELHNSLGVVRYRHGRYEDAAAAFRKAIELGARCPIVYLNVGHVLRQQDRIDEAIEAFRNTIREFPTYAPAYDYLVELLREQKRYEEAINTLEAFVEANPESPAAHQKIAHNLLMLDTSERDTKRAVEFARRATDLDDQSSSHWLTLGMAHYYAMNYLDAAESLQRAQDIESRPRSRYIDFPRRMIRSRIASYQAMTSHQQGDEQSAKYLQFAETYLAPLSFSSHLHDAKRADIYQPAVDAIRDARSVLGISSELRGKDRVFGLIKAFEEIVADNPTDSHAASELARLYVWYGQPGKHFEVSRRNLLSIDKGDGAAAERFVKALLCVPSQDKELLEFARRLMRETIANSTDNSRPYNFASSGIAEYRAGNFREADRLLTVAIQHFPQSNGFWLKLVAYSRLYRCMARFHQGMVAEARADFELSRATVGRIPSREECTFEPYFGDRILIWMAYEEASRLLGIDNEEDWYDPIEVYETIVDAAFEKDPRQLHQAPLRLAVLYAWHGRQQDRTKLCRQLFDLYTPNMGPGPAEQFAKACLSYPVEDQQLLQRAANLGRRGFEMNSRATDEWILYTAGLAEFRLENFEKAIELFTQARKRFDKVIAEFTLSGSGDGQSDKQGMEFAAAAVKLFRAMAYHHSGESDKAKADYEDARKTAEIVGSRYQRKLHPNFQDQLIMWMAFEECRLLLPDERASRD